MPIPQLKKRTYGYIGGKKGKKPRQKKKFKKRPVKNFRKRKGSKKILTSIRHFISDNKIKLLKGMFGFFVIGFLLTTVMVAWASKDLPDPDRLTDRQVAQSTKIYDRTGEHLLYEIFANEKRTLVTLDEIPEELVKGVIATEDTAFYEHKGIRPLSILRSVVYGIIGKSRVGSGASTLTQQLVKNAILTNERRLSRKIKEIILSIRLEQKFTKQQILQIYFNEIPYGSTNYGVESAAQSYFGKHVSDLSLSESAVLAGLPKAPSHYLNNPESLKNRRDFVLFRMVEEGFITKEEKEKAQAEPIELKQRVDNIQAPHFVLYVKEQLVEKYGEAVVETGGLEVITSLDWEKQQIAEKVMDEVGTQKLADAGADNASLVALDPKTGHILSMVGSHDFFNDEIDGQFNVATLGKRQPGSSFKPIVYAAAFEKGYTPDTILFDTVTNFAASGKAYIPQNYDLQEHGPMTMRKALQGSLNLPAVKTLYLVGSKKGVTFAERMGYSTLSEGVFGLTLVLGGGEVKLLEHTNAFATFANGGELYEPISILKIEDNSGKVLDEWKKEKGERVLDPSIAATVSNVLSDDQARSFLFGAGGILTLPGRPVATKTGTTNNYIDAWTVGYTPSLVTGVWAGNTDNSPMKRGYGGSRVAAPIWNQFMREALADQPAEAFPAPPANTATKPVLKGSAGGGITLMIDKVTGKIATSSTPEKYIEEKMFIQPHSLLHYVQKDDPRGDPPENPEWDPQYFGWEKGIQDWITRKKEEDPDWDISFEEPPTEFDDIHSLELIPTLEIVYPQFDSILTTRQIDTDIRVTAPRGVKKVTYRLDDAYIGIVNSHPFNLNYYAENIEPGEHTLSIIVEDDVGNKLEEEVTFLLDVDPAPAGVSFVNTPSQISGDDFPAAVFFNYHKLNEIEEIRLYLQNGAGEKSLVLSTDDFSNIFNDQLAFDWNNAPNPGNYSLIAEITVLGGGVRVSDQMGIEVK